MGRIYGSTKSATSASSGRSRWSGWALSPWKSCKRPSAQGHYHPGQIHRNNAYLFKKGTEVYLLDMGDGKVLVMQSWTDFANKGETSDNLKDLGGQFKQLPAGWKFRSKASRQGSQRRYAASARPPGVGDAGRVSQHVPGLRLRRGLQLRSVSARAGGRRQRTWLPETRIMKFTKSALVCLAVLLAVLIAVRSLRHGGGDCAGQRCRRYRGRSLHLRLSPRDGGTHPSPGTNVLAPEGTQAPVGQFARLRTYPNASYRDVTAPNAETLYTYGYFDVSKEPWVISIPDLKGRYAVFSLFDGWTTVFGDPGKRTTGTGAQTIAVTGPGWSGTLPRGVKEYKSATAIALFNGKIYCTGTEEDYKLVHAVQDELTAVPLSPTAGPTRPSRARLTRPST